MVLYEFGFKFDFVFLVPVIMLIFITFFPLIWRKFSMNYRNQMNMELVKIFCGCAASFVTIISIIVTISMIYQYKNISDKYNNGDYLTVDGLVENFVPMPYSGHSDETFDINGVNFAYSDFDLSQTGYNISKSHGGVITGNGQHLYIRYIINDGTNCILYIKQVS